MATEKRLIDANELVDTIYRSDEALHSTQWETDEIVDQIDRIPTVDAVEVVRCKDCIHWYETEGVCLKIYSDGAVSPYAWQDRNLNDFCSYGERKTDV